MAWDGFYGGFFVLERWQQLFAIVRYEQLAKGCFCVSYKKCDLKTIKCGERNKTKDRGFLPFSAIIWVLFCVGFLTKRVEVVYGFVQGF